MEQCTYAQKVIADAIALKTTDGIYCETYNDTGCNDCGGGCCDTDD